MPWHPPIPAGRLYSPDALDLGPALAMLVWCYDQIDRDGRIEVQLPQAATDIGKPYGTIKDWWRQLRAGPFFCEAIDRGKRGWVVRMSEDWIDWHVMGNNYPSKIVESRDVNLEDFSRSGESRDVNLDDDESSVKAPSKRRQGRDVNLENLHIRSHIDHNPTSSSSQIETSSDDGVDDFVKNLLREFPISRKKAREIALTGADYETVVRSLKNNGDPHDPRSYGKILDRIVGAPPPTGKPYDGPFSKKPTQNGASPPPPKTDTVSSKRLAEMAKDITL